MSPFQTPESLRRSAMAVLLALAASAGHAHDFRLGALVIDHPYALPSPPGASTGAVYLRGLKNSGSSDDRLIGARTPAAGSVEIHRSTLDGSVMRMRAVDAVPLPAGSETRLRHGGEWHLMLVGLKAPLKVGDRITMTLQFERAGEKEIRVDVQQVRSDGKGHAH